MIGIYKITNLITGQSYIGKSINIEKRWKRHLSTSTNSNDKSYNYPLYQAIREYGQNNFSWEVLEECSKTQLNEKERCWIAFYDTYENGYNQTLGGDCLVDGVRFSKLTETQVREIKQKLLTQKYTLKKLSEEYNVHPDTIRDINNGWTWVEEGMSYPLYISVSHPLYQKKKNFCLDCGQEISKGAERCYSCENKHRLGIVNIPTKELLEKELFLFKGNFVQVGKNYNVSDNTIRNWCKKYGLPFHSKDYKPVIEKPKRTSPEKCQVNQYDLNNNFIQSFESYAEAARWLENNGYVSGSLNGVRGKIGEVCKGKRKTAYKFIWRDVE